MPGSSLKLISRGGGTVTAELVMRRVWAGPMSNDTVLQLLSFDGKRNNNNIALSLGFLLQD